MPFFDAPTVIAVKAASAMRPEQYNPKFTTAQFDAEIASLIQSAVDSVTGAILKAKGKNAWPPTPEQLANFDAELNADEERERQKRKATDAALADALARLWEGAGQLDDEYDEESDRLRALADRELESLVGSIEMVVGAQPATGESTSKTIIRRPRSSVRALKVVA